MIVRPLHYFSPHTAAIRNVCFVRLPQLSSDLSGDIDLDSDPAFIASAAYDGVVVSTRRDLEGLTNAGYHGKVRQIYPHSDAADWTGTTAAASQAFADKLGLRPDDPVILCVARMDPIKRQDLAIRALKRVKRRHPRAQLVLVGNGSFSGRKGPGGLGLSKAHVWRDRLEAEVHHRGVTDSVHFTGWLPDTEVAAAYARADVLVLPSDLEGFGLTPYEAWANGKPCVLSQGCGAAEVVQEDVNGHLFPAGDDAALAEALEMTLGDSEAATRMGQAGRATLRAHSAARASSLEGEVIEDAMRRFGGR